MISATATTALRVLSGIERSLGGAQARISTGLKVSTARDNAAIWSVSTMVKSDIATNRQIKSNLGILQGQLAVARSGAEQIAKLSSEVKEAIVRNNGDCRVDVGNYLNTIRQILKSTPLLTEEVERLVPSFVQGREAQYLKVRGFDLTPPDTLCNVLGVVHEVAFDHLSLVGGKIVSAVMDGPEVTRMVRDFRVGDILSVEIDGVRHSVELTTPDLWDSLVSLELKVGAGTGFGGIYDDPLLGSEAAVSVNFDPGSEATSIGPLRLERRGTDTDWFEPYMQRAIDVAAAIGAMQMRIEIQTEYLATVVNALTEGVGVLVDADIQEESARLVALQTQRELALQGLAIANQAPQALLQLFGR